VSVVAATTECVRESAPAVAGGSARALNWSGLQACWRRGSVVAKRQSTRPDVAFSEHNGDRALARNRCGQRSSWSLGVCHAQARRPMLGTGWRRPLDGNSANRRQRGRWGFRASSVQRERIV
jgi:hypothetical protein